MRMTFLRTTLSCLIAIAIFQPTLQAQEDSLFIVGPTEVCFTQGISSIYTLVPSSPNDFYFWELSYFDIDVIITENYEGNPIEIFWQFPGNYVLSAYSEFTNQTISINITVSSGGGTPQIRSTADFLCPANNTEPDTTGIPICEKVCANSTVTYTVDGENVEWLVEGSDNFTVNGNEVTVEWGDPGTGTVSVFTGGEVVEPFSLQCGMFEYLPNGVGSGYAFVDGGVPPYTYFLSNGQTSGSGGNPVIFEELQEGTYVVTVTDATGQSAECAFTIAGDPFGCNLSAYADITYPDCASQGSEASIDLTVVGGFGNYIFEWSGPNGFTSSEEDIFLINFNDFQEGTYVVSIIEGFECVRTYSYYLGCNTNSCGGEASICVEILEEVEAAFTSTPAADNGTIEVCLGQAIFFENQSSNAEDYLWDFGDGNFSTETDPEYIYANPGTYELTLIARNECFCSDTTSVMVEVTPTESPTIDCVGTICPETSVTYTTDAACSSFDWLVSSNGSVDDGGGMGDNFITITWNDGVEGTIQLTTTGCSGGGCDVPATFIVPILSNDAVIRGPEKVCNEENAIYTIPDFDGTSINWVVSPLGTILTGQGTNQITVQWSGTLPIGNQQFVQVDYDNCYLGCSGSDVLNVDIVPEYFITGDIEACVNGATDYKTQNALNNNPINSNWTVRAADGSVFFTSTGATNAITVDWSGMPGQYTVQAVPANPDDFCNETELRVSVLPAPSQADAIQGEDFICPSETYTYAAVSSQSNVSFKWYINNGGTMSEQEGRFVNVTWGNTAPYSISLAQISTQGLPCESDTITLDIGAIAGFTITGTDEVCEDDIATFTATSFENVLYNWSISPASAGTIAEGEGTDAIEILWHEPGVATVQLDVCGMTETFNVTVHAKPELMVNHPIGLCEGETAEVTTSVLYTDYIWSNEDGVTVSNDPNPMLAAGYYKVSAVNEFGCRGDTTFYIDPYPMPEVRISSPNDASLCPGGPMITIFALNEVNGYSYQWYLDDTAIAGATNVTHDTNIGGRYHVEVTDENGCVAPSNSFIIVTCDDIGGTCQNGICFIEIDGGGGGGCTANGTIDFSHVETAFCNEIDFTNTSTNFLPGTLTWNFNDPSSGADNFSTLENPSHTFSDAGFFRVQLIGQVQDANDPAAGCTRRMIYPVEVKAVANFDWSDACAGETVDFRDISRFLPTTDIVAWDWNFADPASGANNTSTDQDPAHIFTTGGIYDVELIVTTTDGCQASIVREVEVYAPPVINFDPPVQNCQATALNFIADVPVTVTSIQWNFGDPSSGAANTSELFDTYHAYENTGNYTVTMIATSIYGCVNTFSQAITVTPNNLNGDITAAPMSPICEGDSTVLTAPVGTAWMWSTGENTQSIIVHEAGIYKVTVMDDEGCEYNPTPMIIDIIPAPDGSIRAVEYDDFGQPIDYFYEGYETCEGEDVYLEMLDNANYTYSWSSGGDMSSISFTEERGNLLAAGNYDYEVTITDVTTGCSNVIGPFSVIVNELPQNVTISSSSPGTLCAGTSTTLSVDNPDAALTYQWNTGETGTSIIVFNGGEYYVQATNEFGCSSESNRIDVLEGPRIRNIPSGCHTRCNPDTICLPDMPTVASYQWYLDGVAIPAPEGTVADYIATESGDYTVEMTDIFGCNATSDVLTLDLFEGFGTLFGNVYFDVNDNGVIDAADTLMNGVGILLQDDMGTTLNSTNSDIDGAYTFVDIPANPYTLAVDTLNLGDNLSALIVSSPAELVGCDDMEQFDWLIIKDCEPTDENLVLSACTGTSIDYEGNTLQPGETLTLNYLTADGCDSMLNISVIETLPTTASLTLATCDGQPIEYEGTSINVGDAMDFNYINAAGCDSTLTVQVIDGSTMVATTLILEACNGEVVNYNGTDYPIGTAETFTFQNQYGCDSLVELSVTAASTITFALATTSTCPNIDNGSIAIENINGGTMPYEYSLDGVMFQFQPTFDNLTSSDYTITLRDANGCEFTEMASIEMSESLEVELLDRELLCGSDNVDITASLKSGNPAEVIWSWENGGIDSTLTVTEPGAYQVQVSNACETIDLTATVTLENNKRESYIYIPNAFSPNGDNINEHFYGQMAADAELMEYEMQVFDRWGNKVFEAFDINNQWDGNFETRKLKPGVYIWSVKAKVESCREEIDVFYRGDVTIMR